MSLKITLEVDGQTEQQLAPLVSRWVVPPPAQPAGQELARPHITADVCPDNSALLQQQLQQLAAQNQWLQAQLSQQHLMEMDLGGRRSQATELSGASTGRHSQQRSPQAAARPHQSKLGLAAPLLPVQYRTARRSRIGQSLKQLSAWLWQQTRHRWKGLLLFCLLCAGTYGALALSFELVDRALTPEFASDGPGEAISPSSDQTLEAPDTEQPSPSPASPTSKAGSHPPPPPAFEQP